MKREAAIFGADRTQSWTIAGLTSTQTVGILAACWMMLATAVVVLVVSGDFCEFLYRDSTGDGRRGLEQRAVDGRGPIFFSLLALGIYENYRRRTAVSFVVSAG